MPEACAVEFKQTKVKKAGHTLFKTLEFFRIEHIMRVQDYNEVERLFRVMGYVILAISKWKKSSDSNHRTN
jgi:hypothetical protein